MSWSPRRVARSTTCAAARWRCDTLQIVVLDEADEMLDMGFAEDLEAILDATPEERQTALFSATLPPRITAIANEHLHDPVRDARSIARTARPGRARHGAPGGVHRAARAQDGGARPRARHREPHGGDRLLPHAHRGGRAQRDAQRRAATAPRRCTVGSARSSATA
ncbi:MAG: DEAD/DEAH box helicase [Gemmatimonadaceae bacterium]|nr:DEAD/DEAH box helicase [Gemmatimonadaceae bacterium]